MNLSLLSFLFIFINLSIASGQLLEGIYCGEQNCYEVLNITREATRSEISKAYRLLAKKVSYQRTFQIDVVHLYHTTKNLRFH